MARTVLPIAGAVIGAYFGGAQGAQWGYALGSLGAAAIPQKIEGPRIGETGAQTSSEGAQRAIVYGTCQVTGNVIASGPLIKRDVSQSQGKGGSSVSEEHAYRTFAVRMSEGPIEAYLRIWEDDKLVYDMRAESVMLAESQLWAKNVVFYFGDEDQLPDPTLQMIFGATEVPAHRGSAYFVKIEEDLTDRRGSIPQYRCEVANSAVTVFGALQRGPVVAYPNRGYLTVDSSGYPLMQTKAGSGTSFGVVNVDDTYAYTRYDASFTLLDVRTTTNVGDTLGDKRLWPLAFDEAGWVVSMDGNFGYCKLIQSGSQAAYFKPTLGAADGWWYAEEFYAPEYGGLIWLTATSVYLGARRTGGSGTNWNRVMRFPKQTGSGFTLPLATITDVDVRTAPADTPFFWMHVSRQGKVRTINSAGVFKAYDAELVYLHDEPMPVGAAGLFPAVNAIFGFGVDEAKDALVLVRIVGVTSVADIYRLSTGELLTSIALDAETSPTTRVLFTVDAIYIQRYGRPYRIAFAMQASGLPMPLSSIVSDIHARCDFPAEKFDASELTDMVTGLVLAGEYTGADAINTLRSLYLFDRADYDKVLHYPKRGGAVVATLTIDDLVEEPDTSNREQAIEFPRKLHLSYQNATGGYAVAKATSSRSSPDVRVVGETTVQVPVVLTPDQAAQAAVILHKVSYAEAEGEVKLSVPESFIRLVPSNCIGLSLRGRVSRLRIDQIDTSEGVITLTMRHDRQSAYTSTVTGVPIPEPTPPPPTLVGETILAVIDMSPRIDSEDDLNLLYAVTGAMPAWSGAMVQRSLDAGASYANVAGITRAAVMGTLVNGLSNASEYYTDTTNVIRVQLYRDSQTIDSITDAQFLSEGGAFVIQRPDGSCEVLQYRDAVEVSDGVYDLSHLHRGQLNSGTSAHLAGALLIGLDRAVRVDAQSTWIGATLTHRAVSSGQAPELAAEQSDTYTGKSQREWPVAYVSLARSGANVITGTWTPRHRLGSDDAPVASINFTGYRVTLDDGVHTAVTFDSAASAFSFDASALNNPLTVTVSALNRITGAGPSTSGAI